jgi:enoyl-CoA hydratase/carnithine racemase
MAGRATSEAVKDVTEGPILISRDGNVHVITFNRPERMNALDLATHDLLVETLQRVDRDPHSRAVLVTGSGRAFCAGGDLKAAQDRGGAYLGDLVGRPWVHSHGREIIHAVLSMDKPTVAMVNGAAAGLGANLALLMDAAVVDEDAIIGDTHVRAGLVAGDGAAVIWPLLVGPNRAKEFLMTSRMLNGRDAARIGLVNAAVPKDELRERAFALAHQFADQAPYAAMATKAIINQYLWMMANLTLDIGLAWEHLSQQMPDCQEAIRAWNERRPAVFTGKM